MNKTRFKILYLKKKFKNWTDITKIRWNIEWRDTYDWQEASPHAWHAEVVKSVDKESPKKTASLIWWGPSPYDTVSKINNSTRV